MPQLRNGSSETAAARDLHDWGGGSRSRRMWGCQAAWRRPLRRQCLESDIISLVYYVVCHCLHRPVPPSKKCSLESPWPAAPTGLLICPLLVTPGTTAFNSVPPRSRLRSPAAQGTCKWGVHFEGSRAWSAYSRACRLYSRQPFREKEILFLTFSNEAIV